MHLIWAHRIFWNKTTIFTVMCFVEPTVLLFAICYSNMYVYLSFTKIFAKLLPNLYPEVLYFLKS